LVAAVLPTGDPFRSEVRHRLLTIINTETPPPSALSLQTNIPATFTFQTTDPRTNALTGSPNTGRHSEQRLPGFLIAITPTADHRQVALNFAGTNTSPHDDRRPQHALLSASTTATPGVIALSSTASNDGIVNLSNVVSRERLPWRLPT
jgi:hypothetical protein